MSEIKKPVITKEQAEALILLQGDLTDSAILELYVGDSLAVRNPRNRCLYDLDLLTLAAALINGYEVEKTPEEKLRQWFEEEREIGDEYYNRGEEHRSQEVVQTIIDTLNILGIKIEGVNA
ncbi:hypothetical protein P4U97_21470 [Bacillus swezeyi]|uniref:hypothetical protein n=1 Tax=Bacillus swezeyi TaxID=1925020 RepID=UPI002E1A88DE|nr:hypothetical protein [Bacillus swezeyi]